MKRLYYWVDHTSRYPYNTGIQRVARNLASGLQEIGAPVAYVSWDRAIGAFGPLSPARLAHLSKWHGPSPARAARYEEPPARGAWLLLPELLMYENAPLLEDVIARARALGLRVAAIFFDAIPYKLRELYPGHHQTAHADYMRKLSEADAILAISETSRRDLAEFIEHAPARSIALERRLRAVLLPGEFKGTPRVTRETARSGSAVRILSVGTVEPRKNHLGLVRAYRKARARFRAPAELTIVGGCPFETLGRALEAELGRTPGVAWLRSVADDELQEHYARATFTVYPSLEEGFGLPILESLWHGRPCLCHAGSGMLEAAAGGGCLTLDLRDAPAFSAALERMANDEALRDRLAREAMQRPLRSWADYAREVTATLDEIGGESGMRENEVQLARRAPRGHELRRPVLSACITTYNRAHWLRHSLPVLLARAAPYADLLEVLVVDNASADETEKVAGGYLGRPGFRYVRNPSNVGMLGNLAVTAREAQGEYLWIIGDDDLVTVSTIDRILAAIAEFPDVPLIYLNYSYTRIDAPESLADPAPVFAGAVPIAEGGDSRWVPEARQIAARTENCFTAIYSCVFRRDHGVRAYTQDTAGEAFTSLLTCVPTSVYVVSELFDKPAVWIGWPSVVVNMNVSWLDRAPLFVLERFPELYDLMELKGADKAALDDLRRRSLPGVFHFLGELLDSGDTKFDPYFSLERLMRRLKHLPEFRARVGEYLGRYDAARARGRFAEEPSGGALRERFGLEPGAR